MRYAAAIEYSGTNYSGWQIQPHAASVQAGVEEALTHVANHKVEVVCAGRTDSGVHATCQIIHFDSNAERSVYNWVRGANSNMPDDVVCRWVVNIADDFHARFSAQQRSYRYIIFNQPQRSAILERKVTWERRSLDLSLIQDAASSLIGEHDFTSFRTVHCQAKSPVRTIHTLEVTQSAAFVYLDIVANAFLHHMVRNIAGVLLEVGCKAQAVGWVQEVLDARDRSKGGVTAPPHGLYLSSVTYPPEYELPAAPTLINFG